MCAGLFAYKKNGETPPLTICYCCFDDCSIRVYAVSFLQDHSDCSIRVYSSVILQDLVIRILEMVWGLVWTVVYYQLVTMVTILFRQLICILTIYTGGLFSLLP